MLEHLKTWWATYGAILLGVLCAVARNLISLWLSALVSEFYRSRSCAMHPGWRGGCASRGGSARATAKDRRKNTGQQHRHEYVRHVASTSGERWRRVRRPPRR